MCNSKYALRKAVICSMQFSDYCVDKQKSMDETLDEIERMKRRLLHFLSRGLKGSSQAAKDQNLKNMVALALDLFIKGKAF